MREKLGGSDGPQKARKIALHFGERTASFLKKGEAGRRMFRVFPSGRDISRAARDVNEGAPIDKLHPRREVSTPQETAFDSEYVQRLHEAFEGDLPRSFDVWLTKSLDSKFYPLCQELVEKTARLGTEEISKAYQEMRKPKTFPQVNLPYNERYLGLAKFIDEYDPSESKADYVTRMESQRQQRKQELHEVMGIKLDLSDSANRTRYGTTVNNWHASRYAVDEYDYYINHFADMIPQDPEDREQFKASVLARAAASELDDTFPLSAPAQTVTIGDTSLFKGDEDLADHFLQSALFLPNWSKDTTITEDLLSAVSIMASQLPQLKPSAAKTAAEAPLFLQNETLRAKEVDLPLAPVMTVLEGLFSTVQSINTGLGQVINEYPMDEEAAVEKLVKDRVPTQTARSLPIGYLGPITLNGKYIKELFHKENGIFTYNPEYKRKGSKIKQEKRQSRKTHPDYHKAESYLHRIKESTLASEAGGICPVSMDHEEVDTNQDKQSGIDLLSNELFRVFKVIRQIRKEL